jgi:hypothetical protein
MKITLNKLEELRACDKAIELFEESGIKSIGLIPLIKRLKKEKYYDWALWLYPRCVGYKKRLKFAIYAASPVLLLYEKKYPKDDRPRKAIEAVKKCIKNPSTKNKNAAANAADAAADAADAAAYAADAAANAADAAADAAANAAANAANAAADAANAAAYAADAAAYAAYAAANAAYAAAERKVQLKIIDYAIKQGE